jgi:hypothetical protein
MLVSLRALSLGLTQNLIAGFLGQMMMRLDGLGFTIAMAFVARMAWPADVGRLTVWMLADGRGKVTLISMAI